jgi:uncharacterized protein YukE
MSYTDPEILYGKLTSGDAGRITAAAEPVNATLGALSRAGESITGGTSTAAAAWQGDAATEFASRADRSGTATSTAHERISRAVRIVESAAGAFTTMRGGAERAIAAWRSRPAGLAPDALTRLANEVNAALSTVRDGYEQALRGYASALRDVTPAFEETAGGTEAWAATALRPGLSVPPPNTDPTAVAQWWKSLSETERDQLLATQFDRLGRLRGLPAEVLDAANRRRIEVDQTLLAATDADLDARITRRATELGLDPNDESALRTDPELAGLLDQRQENDRLLGNANDAANRLADARNLAERNGFTDGVYVLHYDSDGLGGDGALGVAFGNPDTAQNVAVSVPGTGTTLAEWFPLGDAAALRAQMDAAGGQNATIAWLNYDAPTWDLSVTSADGAAQGGEQLAADVAGYRAAAEGTQHITLVGHSYGSTVVGYAGMAGATADELVFLGSPGVGASNVDQLSAGAGHVWAGATEHDPVVQATSGDWFTADGSSTGPYDDSFGANVFGTESDANALKAHLDYYRPGSESLENVANIATGNYDAVTEQDWLDDPLPPELPLSDKPIVGPVIDAGANIVKEGVDVVTDIGGGLWDAGGDALSGDWDGAWHELTDTGADVVKDVVDTTAGVLGDAGELGRDLVEGGKSLYDNTLGKLF